LNRIHFSKLEFIGLYSKDRVDGRYNCGAVLEFNSFMPIVYGQPCNENVKGDYVKGENLKI
jgi:hypothetical protein